MKEAFNFIGLMSNRLPYFCLSVNNLVNIVHQLTILIVDDPFIIVNEHFLIGALKFFTYFLLIGFLHSKNALKKGFTLSILITIPQIHKKRYEYFHILNLNCVDSWKS